MLNQFKTYAFYYDLLYHDKDYRKESTYIHSLIQKYRTKSKSILSLGCGTGKYENELSKFGYEITGIDMSEQMIAIAQKSDNPKCQFVQGDIRTARLGKKFDIVISLFHVINYQTTDEDLLSAFKTVHEHLINGGIFLFDFWYGPAVLAEPPYPRTKTFENDSLRINRTAFPKVDKSNNTVTVDYKVKIFNKLLNETEHLHEVHRLRYLFLPELEFMLKNLPLNIVSSQAWLSDSKRLNSKSWYGLIVASK